SKPQSLKASKPQSLKASKPQSLKASKPQSFKACRMIECFQFEGSGIELRRPIVELNKKIYWRGNVEWQRKVKKYLGAGMCSILLSRFCFQLKTR
ncbi:hypothetical protein, partial [Bartonella apihabitans]|uniref:hypothetical protein n=1 Tax=Bartonella apihabitans TaxID=2750929 RepID=UPI001AEF34E5